MSHKLHCLGRVGVGGGGGGYVTRLRDHREVPRQETVKEATGITQNRESKKAHLTLCFWNASLRTPQGRDQ